MTQIDSPAARFEIKFSFQCGSRFRRVKPSYSVDGDCFYSGNCVYIIHNTTVALLTTKKLSIFGNRIRKAHFNQITEKRKCHSISMVGKIESMALIFGLHCPNYILNILSVRSSRRSHDFQGFHMVFHSLPRSFFFR